VISKKRTAPEKSGAVESDNLSSLAEALAAVDRTVIARLEGNLAGLAALSTNCIIHLTGAAITAAASACHTACLAALGLIGKAFFCIKFLLTSSKGEFLSAIFADERLVFVHVIPLKNNLVRP
jgi:hypothetical protein